MSYMLMAIINSGEGRELKVFSFVLLVYIPRGGLLSYPMTKMDIPSNTKMIYPSRCSPPHFPGPQGVRHSVMPGDLGGGIPILLNHLGEVF